MCAHGCIVWLIDAHGPPYYLFASRFPCLDPHSQVLTNFLLPATRDAHHRVRWAALNAIAQLCNDYAPDFERENHALIMPVLIEVCSLSVFSCPRDE